MMRATIGCLALLSVASSIAAQTTWIVNAGGGPGVHFTDLPSAVAAAATGDTILVQTGPFGEGATPFSTNKGLTIVGEGGQVPMTSSAAAPFEVTQLPAGASFRMVGFDQPADGELNFRVVGCLGRVHLERLRCREPGFFFPTWPSIEIVGSSDVTMRDVATFGSPAVAISGSNVDLVGCRLGVTHIGLGGGVLLDAVGSVVDVVQPLFDTGFGAAAAITASATELTIAGNTLAFANASYVRNPAGVVVQAAGGSVRHDPAVTLTPGPGSLAIAGSAAVQSAIVAASWTTAARPGQPMLLQARSAPGSIVWPVLGEPAVPTASPLGPVAVDLNAPWFLLAPSVASSLGATSATIVVPPALLLGSAYTTQALVLDAGVLSVGLPCSVVLH